MLPPEKQRVEYESSMYFRNVVGTAHIHAV
jgi:hypothetical protein